MDTPTVDDFIAAQRLQEWCEATEGRATELQNIRRATRAALAPLGVSHDNEPLAEKHTTFDEAVVSDGVVLLRYEATDWEGSWRDSWSAKIEDVAENFAEAKAALTEMFAAAVSDREARKVVALAENREKRRAQFLKLKEEFPDE